MRGWYLGKITCRNTSTSIFCYQNTMLMTPFFSWLKLNSSNQYKTLQWTKLTLIYEVPSFSKGNCNVWLVGVAYGVSVGIYGLWCGLMDVNLWAIGISQKEAGWLGFYATSTGCVAAVLFGRSVLTCV